MSGTLGVRQPDGKKGIHVCVCVCVCVCCVCVCEGGRERARARARAEVCALGWGGENTRRRVSAEEQLCQEAPEVTDVYLQLL